MGVIYISTILAKSSNDYINGRQNRQNVKSLIDIKTIGNIEKTNLSTIYIICKFVSTYQNTIKKCIKQNWNDWKKNNKSVSIIGYVSTVLWEIDQTTRI